MVSRTMLIIGGLMVAAVFAYLFFYPIDTNGPPANDWERKVSFAVDKAGQACLDDTTTTQRKEIESRVEAEIGKIGAAGNATVESTRRAVDIALSEGGLLQEREKVRECIKDRLLIILGTAQTATPSPAPVKPAAPAIGPPAAVGQGYVYYEEAAGESTDDGVFGLAQGSSLPAYDAIKAGTVLEARSTARMREGPSSRTALRGKVEAGQCVRVISPPANESKPQNASSGGYLQVEKLSGCP